MKRIHRKKELSEVQALKLENKSLRDENRNIKKELKRLQRKEHNFEIENYEEPENIITDKTPIYCPICNKGHVSVINIIGRTWEECSQCDYRSKTKYI
jgi:transposase-like protein